IVPRPTAGLGVRAPPCYPIVMSLGGVPSWLRAADRRLIETLRRTSVMALRIALGVVFVWFGALKVAGVSPVARLVADTLFWLPGDVAVRHRGGREIVVGLGVFRGWAIRLTLLVFTVQMVGTFLVFVLMPWRTFEGVNPLRLTVEGEFVIKNLVLLTAGLVIAASIPKAHESQSLGEMLTERRGETLPAPEPRRPAD